MLLPCHVCTVSRVEGAAHVLCRAPTKLALCPKKDLLVSLLLDYLQEGETKAKERARTPTWRAVRTFKACLRDKLWQSQLLSTYVASDSQRDLSITTNQDRDKESTLAIFNIYVALCTSCPIVNASRGNNLACNLPDNCIGLANKFVSYAELEGLLVSYIAWRMKYLQEGETQKRNRFNKRGWQ